MLFSLLLISSGVVRMGGGVLSTTRLLPSFKVFLPSFILKGTEKKQVKVIIFI